MKLEIAREGIFQNIFLELLWQLWECFHEISSERFYFIKAVRLAGTISDFASPRLEAISINNNSWLAPLERRQKIEARKSMTRSHESEFLFCSLATESKNGKKNKTSRKHQHQHQNAYFHPLRNFFPSLSTPSAHTQLKKTWIIALLRLMPPN